MGIHILSDITQSLARMGIPLVLFRAQFTPTGRREGILRQMPSSHSGFLELLLETGRIGYWIFLVFIYASLHCLERVRRKDPVRAWFYLSVIFLLY